MKAQATEVVINVPALPFIGQVVSVMVSKAPMHREFISAVSPVISEAVRRTMPVKVIWDPAQGIYCIDSYHGTVNLFIQSLYGEWPLAVSGKRIYTAQKGFSSNQIKEILVCHEKLAVAVPFDNEDNVDPSVRAEEIAKLTEAWDDLA